MGMIQQHLMNTEYRYAIYAYSLERIETKSMNYDNAKS